MGVEPTTDTLAVPVTGFEDRGIHRDTSTPVALNPNPKRTEGQKDDGGGQVFRALSGPKPRRQTQDDHRLSSRG